MIYSKTYPKDTPMACSRCVFGQGEHETWCEKFRFMGMRVKVDPTLKPGEFRFEYDDNIVAESIAYLARR